MKNCPIAELCKDYNSGDRKPPNHDVRNKIPCKYFLDMSCEDSIRIQIKCGQTIACDIEKIRRIKK